MLVVILLWMVATVACNQGCPLWFRLNDQSGECECGDELGGLVHCDQQTKKVSLLFCYCMTYSDAIHTTVVGPCLSMCTRRHTPKCQSLNQIETSNTSVVNAIMCGFYHRDGVLCGKCKRGYAFPVYSYTMKCIHCSDDTFIQNLAKYIAVSFLPLTAIYIIIVVFKVSVTTGNMVAYVLTCQILTTPFLLRAITHSDQNHFILSWFAIWNLDLLRLVSPPFCLTQNMGTLQILALDYLVGVYPLFLIFLTYIAVTLHDRYPIIVKIWRPAHRVLRYIRLEWNIRGSLIQSFATFLILSYMKILNISFDLLMPVYLKTSDGKTLNKARLFINAEIILFDREHLPYGILAVVMLVLFSLLPMLFLLLYLCKCFRNCLRKCRLSTQHLEILMNAFQGCYRRRPRDCRYFTGFYALVRIVFLITAALVKDPTVFSIYGYYFLGLAAMVTLVEPYKVRYHNKIDAFFFLMYATLSFLGGLYVYLVAAEPQIIVTPIFVSIITPMSLIVILYGVAVVLRQLVPKAMFIFIKKSCTKVFCKGKVNAEENINDTLPYRLEIET